ncbi:Serine/threonine-protein kinase Nek8 [Symbiodinium microadriaticum]|uniref:non-specific serine/threonine protein kinase n=1 Tax=Symbiodinium microadriaticum TaxID=2951 RepID=A0A1Q9C5A4_SYMMI|nr:Serine/threonine-protein kinase Nek8 [Symbiodinium microadriaticum]
MPDDSTVSKRADMAAADIGGRLIDTDEHPGLSADLVQPDGNALPENVARVLSNTSFAHTFVGTPYYLSPEICEERPYNELSDVWAFGCVVYEMCTLRHPFEARNQAALLIKILRGQFAPIQASYSQDLRELIDGCLQRELHKRTRLADIFARAAVQSWAAHLAISLEAWSGPVRVQTQRRPPQPRAGSTVSAKATQARSAKGIPRTRVRLDPRAGAGRREEGSKQTLVAPKTRASDRTHVAKGIQDDGKPKLPRCDGEKARLKAEVAELPDVVVATARTSRNVPSVQQLLKMDDSPVKRLLQRNGGRLTQAALQEDAESIEEVTIRPEDTVRQAQAGSDEIREELEAPDSDWDGDAEVTHQSVFEGRTWQNNLGRFFRDFASELILALQSPYGRQAPSKHVQRGNRFGHFLPHWIVFVAGRSFNSILGPGLNTRLPGRRTGPYWTWAHGRRDVILCVATVEIDFT